MQMLEDIQGTERERREREDQDQGLISLFFCQGDTCA